MAVAVAGAVAVPSPGPVLVPVSTCGLDMAGANEPHAEIITDMNTTTIAKMNTFFISFHRVFIPSYEPGSD